MKKNLVVSFLIGSLLAMGISVFATNSPQRTLSHQLAKKIEQAPNKSLQIASFMEKLAQKDPARLANFLLEAKFTYVYNESIVYLGVQGVSGVLVICKINDSDTGNFYYTVHKKGSKVTEEITTTPPSHQGFATLFERK